MLRARGVKAAYQKAKNFLSTKVTKESYQRFVTSLPLTNEDKELLIHLSPREYTGVAERLATYEK